MSCPRWASPLTGKTLITHIDEGLDFLGWRVQRHRKKGTNRHYVYTYPSKKALAAVKDKVRTLCRQDVNLPLETLLHRLGRMLRGWTAYFRFGVSHNTFRYLRAFLWRQVFGWVRRKYRRSNWKELRRRASGGRWWPDHRGGDLVRPRESADHPLLVPGLENTLPVVRRGLKEPPPTGHVERPLLGNGHGGCGGRSGKRTGSNPGTAPRTDPTSWG